MDELITWLRAQLDAEEASAQAVTAEHWREDLNLPGEYANNEFNEAVLAHIARHDPARVLADVAAKRAILDAFEQREHDDSMAPGAEVFGYHATGLLIAIRHLAAAYADRPGYREGWRP